MVYLAIISSMKLNQLLFIIAAIIVGAWLLAMLFKIAAWVINGLVYIAAIVLIIGFITMYLQRRKK